MTDSIKVGHWELRTWWLLFGGHSSKSLQWISYASNSVTDQRTKKVGSDSPGLVDFAIALVNSVFNLPDGQVMFYEEFE